MRDIRNLAGRLFLLSVLSLDAVYTWVWATSVYLSDLHGRYWGTVADWVIRWATTVSQDPIGIVFYTGWGAEYPRWPFAGIAILIVCKFISRTATWKQHFPDTKLIDCRPQYILFLLVSIPLLLSVYGAGAKLNLFWDVLCNTPFYPWHDFAHTTASFIIFSLIVPIDYEGIFKLKYRNKFAVIMGLAWLSSMFIEVTENWKVQSSGLLTSMYNNIIDSLPVDHKAVLSGAILALLFYNGLEYRE